jgi:hypothetical protein
MRHAWARPASGRPLPTLLEELANYTAEQPIGHWTQHAGMTEFTLPQTEWHIRAAEAQVQAAVAQQKIPEAEAEAARAATVTANAASVIVAAVAAIASAFTGYFAWYGAIHPPH